MAKRLISTVLIALSIMLFSNVVNAAAPVSAPMMHSHNTMTHDAHGATDCEHHSQHCPNCQQHQDCKSMNASCSLMISALISHGISLGFAASKTVGLSRLAQLKPKQIHSPLFRPPIHLAL
jgi:hypothetical protein